MKRIKCLLYFPLIIFHLLFFLISKNKAIIKNDLQRYYPQENISILTLWKALVQPHVYRNVFYLRIGGAKKFLLNLLLPGVQSCDIQICNSGLIGEGLYILHGYSIVINPRVRIGKNCTMLHSVTIGDKNGEVPTLGDNVSIGAGAIIIGGITIGNNAKIGAGAIVVEDIPEGCTVVCDKAKILKRYNG